MINRIVLCISNIEILCYKQYSSILEALEDNQIKVEYQCREGYCGSCRCRLSTGKVEWVIKPLAFVDKGEILPCCCRANGNIKINI